MTTLFPRPRQLPRDGTSQQARRLEALDPASAPLDERGLPEWLAQVQLLADQLRWYDEQGRCDETWRYLFDPDALNQNPAADDPQRPQRIAQNLARLAAFVDDPQSIPPDLARCLAPPQITLILVVLQLLQRARDRLNGLTARHLDFYYQDILRFQTRPAEPDRVHVLVTPARGRRQARLPKGSALAAGQDAGGRERVYHTEHELAVNRAQVAELRSLYTEIRITDPASIRRDHPKEQQFMDLLRLAIGDPHPGDALPRSRGWPEPTQSLFTERFKAWIDFAREQLQLEFYQLRELVRRKRIRDNDARDWALINKVLNAVGRRRTGRAFDLAARLGRSFDKRNFDRNLAEALGRSPDFSGLPEVDNMDDLYRLRERETVREFLRTPPYTALATVDRLHPAKPPELAADVKAMMERKLLIDSQWSDINDYLNQAGRAYHQDPGFRVADRDGFVPSEFDENLKAALPELDFTHLPAIGNQAAPVSVTDYMKGIERIETYLFMEAESARFLLNQALPLIGLPVPADGKEEARQRQLWHRADTLLAKARERKSIAQRKDALQALREGDPRPAAEQALRAILAEALGLPAENPPALSTLLDAAQPLLSAELHTSLRNLANAITQTSRLESDWTELIRLAELIQRARLGETATRLERHTWIDLHAYDDATRVYPLDSEDGDTGDRRWRTFGQATLEAHPDNPPQPLIGWALSSPVLAMRQGLRRIQLDLHFAADEHDLTAQQIAAIQQLFAEASPLEMDISSAEGWLTANRVNLSVPAHNNARLSLRVSLEFDASSPAITPPLPELGIENRWPVLRFRLRPAFDARHGRFRNPYPVLRVLQLAAYDCSVQVGDPLQADAAYDPEFGLLEPLLRNDQALLDPSKPFEPFGAQPAVGSRLAIADPELASKRLQSLRFDLAWMGVPNNNLQTHYNHYSRKNALKNESFKIKLWLIDQGNAIEIGNGHSLFNTNATQAYRLVQDELDQIVTTPPPHDESPAKDPTLWPRYLRWELQDPDFQHAVYPAEVAQQINSGGNSPIMLNPPYTPKLKALSISYRAVSQWDPGQGITRNDGDTLFHLHPFGYSASSAADAKSATGPSPLLPTYDNAGELLIGIKDLDSPQRLSLLLQLAEGSANPDLQPAAISWSYLDGDRWVTLDQGQVRRDTTRGLINSGIVELDLPAPGTLPDGRLPGGLYWLRLAAHGRPSSLCDSVKLAAQAVSAVFVDKQNDPSHYLHPLPPESISKPVRPIAGISGIEQPYTSFGGRPAERPQALRTRASERLRHRNRALSAWDYEHLVLARFPQLHKVKCLTAPSEADSDSTDELGLVRLVVIPDIAQQLPANPFAPKASARLLEEIREFLEARIPIGARVQVDNAVFVPVRVRVGIRFHAAFDTSLARSELNEALNRYLSPWAYEEGADVVIGGAIYANSIIDFLERQPAVDYVHQPKLFRFDAASDKFQLVPPSADDAEDGYHVTTGSPDQVLVAARQHDIDIIQPEVDDTVELSGIGYMKIELDFIVAGNAA